MASKRSVTIKGQDCELIPGRPLSSFSEELHTAEMRGVMCERKWRLNPLLGRGKGRQALGWVREPRSTHPGATRHPSKEGIFLRAAPPLGCAV